LQQHFSKNRVARIGVLTSSRGLSDVFHGCVGQQLWRSLYLKIFWSESHIQKQETPMFQRQSLAGPSGGSYSLWRSATITFCESSLPHQSGIRPCGHAHSILALITLSGSGFESAYLLYLPLKSQTLCDFEYVLEFSGSRTPKKIAIYRE